MDSFLRIVVEVRNARAAAAQINEVSKALATVNAASSKGAASGIDTVSAAANRAGSVAKGFGTQLSEAFNGAMNKLGEISGRLQSFGRNLQYTGRQLMASFTLPIVAAFGLAVKAELENEKASTQLAKVYGTLGLSTDKVQTDLAALAKWFDFLSSKFGIQKAQVIGIGADWAQAGATGNDVVKATQLTLEAMTLSTMDAGTATKSLLTIMQAFSLSIDETRTALATLIRVDNASSVTFQDLVTALTRAGGTARTAGVDIQHLAALVSSLVPAAGTAEEAGNSLKTIFSRILAPTKAAAEVMGLMGFQIKSAGWESKNGVERLQALAEGFANLTAPQQALVSTTIATRFQINKFDVLMRDILDPMGNYQQALHASGDATNNLTQYYKELNIVLASNPKAFSIVMTQLENAATKIIIPLMPYLLMFVQYIAGLVVSFTKLSPETQKFVLIGVALLAILPVVAYYVGAVANLFGTLGKALKFFLEGPGRIIGFFESIASGLSSVATVLVHIGGAMWTGISTGAATALDFTGRVLASFGEFASTVFSGIGTVATAVWGGIQAAAAWLWSGLTGIFGAGSATIAAEEAAAAATGAAAWTAASAEEAAAFIDFVSVFVAGAAGIEAIWMALTASMELEWTGAMAGMGGGMQALPVAASGAMIETTAIVEEGSAAAAGAAAAGAAGISVGWVAAIAAAVVAVIAAIIVFRHQIGQIFTDIGHFIVDEMGRAFGFLPQVVQDALMGVWRVVTNMVTQIWKVLSYLNPFARHSPSLVDNVQDGVDIIAAKYASLSNIGQAFRAAVSDMQAFSEATGGLTSMKLDKQRVAIAKNSPEDLPAFDTMAASIERLQSVLPAIQTQYDAQARVVDSWKAALDAANDSLDKQNSLLDVLKRAATDANDALSAAKDRYDALAATVPAGLTAAQDAIFTNEMAQKRLQLEILDMSNAAGMSIDEAKSKLAELQGAYETAQARVTSLRLQGAGSDVLGPMTAEMGSIQQQQSSITTGPLAQLKAANDQLKVLEIEGQRLNLQMAVTFDPMTRQLDKVKNDITELPFDQLIQKLAAAKDQVLFQQQAVDKVNAAVKAQQAVVDGVTARRDALQKTYDAEKQNLDDIKTAYQGITSQINEMQQALSGFASSSAAAKPSALADNFAAAGTGDFAQPAGSGTFSGPGGDIPPPPEIPMPHFDILGPIKDQISNATDWVKNKLTDLGGWISGKANSIFVDPIVGAVNRARDQISGPLGTIRDLAGDVFSPVASAASRVWGGVSDAVSKAAEILTPVFEAIGIALAPLIVMFVTLGSIVLTVMEIVGRNIVGTIRDLVLPILKLLFEFISNILKPVFQMIGALVEIIFMAIFKAIQIAWQGIEPIFKAAVWVIQNVLGPAFMWLWENIVSPVFSWIGDKIDRAWKFISPVFDAIWTGIHSVGDAFSWLYDNVVQPVFTHIVSFVKDRINDVIDVMNGIGTAINWVGDKLGIGIHVDPIPHVGEIDLGATDPHGGGGNFHAAGAVMASNVGPGFRTNGVRAIVGEGNASWPEYVVPTDPAHRGNALRLLMGLENDLGVAHQELAGGGILGSAWGVVSGGVHALESIGDDIIDGLKDAAFAGLIKPAVGVANAALGGIPDPYHSFGVGTLKKILEEVADFFSQKEAEKAAAGGAMTGSGFGWQAITHFLDIMGQAYTVTSTTGGTHASGSRHYNGTAVDLVGDMPAIAGTLMKALPALNELIHNPGYSVKRGQVVDPSYWGSSTWEEHRNHVHAASNIDASEGPGFPTMLNAGPGVGYTGDARSIGRQMAADIGWTGLEWEDLDKLWTRESNWDPYAVNSSSGAYGIPQALGHGHPYDLGDVVAQVQWGLEYISGRYGDPIGAWNHSQATGWYQGGGLLNSLPSFLNGGIVPGAPSTAVPIMAHGQETIVPFGGNSQDGPTLVFNGDLSFPNITDPADVNEFVLNLEALAR